MLMMFMKKYLYYFDEYQLDYLGKFQDESFKRDFFDILDFLLIVKSSLKKFILSKSHHL